MKINETQLKKIIAESVNAVLAEEFGIQQNPANKAYKALQGIRAMFMNQNMDRNMFEQYYMVIQDYLHQSAGM